MKNHNLNSLANVNIELTRRCNKSCWMCGRRKVEKDYPELTLEYGDMDFELARKIARQLWNSAQRMEWLECHKQGRRDQVPLCSYCQFGGVPTGKGNQNNIQRIDEKAIF